MRLPSLFLIGEGEYAVSRQRQVKSALSSPMTGLEQGYAQRSVRLLLVANRSCHGEKLNQEFREERGDFCGNPVGSDGLTVQGGDARGGLGGALLSRCALLMEATARAGRASPAGSRPGENAWTGLAHPVLGRVLTGEPQDGGQPEVTKASHILLEKNGFICKKINCW